MFSRHCCRQSWAWPEPASVKCIEKHLEMGISTEAVNSFFDKTNWRDYKRSDRDVERNGILVRGKETGYDVATFIRDWWMSPKGYELFSVAEVMLAAGHRGVKLRAHIFLSHVQGEHIRVTLKAMKEAKKLFRCATWNLTFFVDLFCLKQCVSGDFSPTKVKAAIAAIGHTVVVLDPILDRKEGNYAPESLQRVWCVYEMYSSIEASIGGEGRNVRLDSVLTWPGFLAHDPNAIETIDVEHAAASNDKDKKAVLDDISTLPCSVAIVNEKVTATARKAMRDCIARLIIGMTLLLGVSCVGVLLLFFLIEYIQIMYEAENDDASAKKSPLASALILLEAMLIRCILWFVFGIGILIEMKSPRSLGCCRMLCRGLCLFLRSNVRAVLIMMTSMGILIVVAQKTRAYDDGIVEVLAMVIISCFLLAVCTPLAPLLRCLRNVLDRILGVSSQIRVGSLRCSQRDYLCALIIMAGIDYLSAGVVVQLILANGYVNPGYFHKWVLVVTSPCLWPLLAWAFVCVKQCSRSLRKPTRHSQPHQPAGDGLLSSTHDVA